MLNFYQSDKRPLVIYKLRFRFLSKLLLRPPRRIQSQVSKPVMRHSKWLYTGHRCPNNITFFFNIIYYIINNRNIINKSQNFTCLTPSHQDRISDEMIINIIIIIVI